MRSQKNIHSFWSQLHKHQYAKKNGTLWLGSRIGIVIERLSNLMWKLHNDSLRYVFDDGTEEVIENWRVTSYLMSLLVKMYQKGSAMVRSGEAKWFLNVVIIQSTTAIWWTIIKSCKKIDPLILDSMEIIQRIVKKKILPDSVKRYECYVNTWLCLSLIISY